MHSISPNLLTRWIAPILLAVALLRTVSIGSAPLHPDEWQVDITLDLLYVSLFVLAVLVYGYGRRLASRHRR